MIDQNTPADALCAFVAGLRYEQLPAPVVDRCEELFLDWIASALAAKGMHPLPRFEAFARAMGPSGGQAEALASRGRTSPYFAAWVNAASSHLVEQDDLHNSSVLHPATVVFPAALAAAQDTGASGEEFIAACVAGYEAGIRIGEFLGRSHYRIFHTTATVGTLAAAVAAGHVLKLPPEQMRNAIGSAGTQAAGLWEFLRDAADSKQLHTAHAAASGLVAAYLARDGVTAARRILDGEKGMAAGMSSDADPARLGDRLGSRWALLETSFKFHASCRHTHPAADALQIVMQREGLAHGDIESVLARVHKGAIDVLGVVDVPTTVHQAKFSMGTVLGLLAVHGDASLESFRDHALSDPAVAAFRDKVGMTLDDAVDAAYPKRWLGRVEVRTVSGARFEGAIDEPRGDPGNTLSRAELADKARRLATFSGAASPAEIDALIGRVWQLRTAPHIGALLPSS
ncbi:MmgE/PrpD family protein [Thauera linaloolentis]|uniref:MmgE/PrpD family protein n=1 Tax=Thauera linaloolentis (strain DSM 12138 / JCM 21573 / CCUG 41526 / CIP 105981 / IAM 15112 / NBRC 102519 / 47Lol) TaxID=1123367 RepID=N6YPV3_THAL4|nr:MmgE/PrpD family protein [Thauera linaloolentis]ENO84263.1 MmgE/PrpD family protein [Thauera linaloolentis 47Lol = DSM 12138]MCM8567699.1 MmgE/PrpD family protein [Thauera linaloolentis]